MRDNKPYSALGGFFEYLNRDCGYEQWSQYLIEKLRVFPAGARGLDVGCGNGYFTRALYRAGYDVKGMDISPQMLSKAVELARREGVAAEFLSGDITRLKLNFRPDFITAVNDCINYIPQDKLAKTFAGVYKNLADGGLFIFDVSSAEKLRTIIGDNVFADNDESAAYMWFNSLHGDRVDMEITVFARGDDGRYERYDEEQTQYIHEEADVVRALGDAGFEVVTEGHLGGNKAERINFICKKTDRHGA